MLSYKDIAKIFEEIEIRLIGSLKRNLTRHKNEEKQYNMNWSAWQAEKLRNLDKFRQENSFIMSDYTKVIDSGTRQIMIDEFIQGMNGINYPGDNEISKEPQFFGIDKVKVNKLIDDVVNLEKHAETAVLRTMDDIYRQTVNKAQLAMSSGSVTLQQAIDIAVQDFLNKGINCIVYRNGRRVNIADYVRMALRTTATRANLQGQSEKIKALGYDTILISSYSMCSETCLPWQGRVYINDVFVMWEGKIEQRSEILYGKSNYCGKWFPLLSSAIQGGLFHPNCRHTLLMWRDGDPIPKPVDNSKNNRRYKLEQHQRLLESNVRKAKRFVAGQTDPSNIRKAKAELINAQKRLREFIQQTNISENETVLKRDYGREKVYENISNSTISVGVNKTTNIDYMSRFTPKYSDYKQISTGSIQMQVKKVSNSRFNMFTDIEADRKDKAVRLAEKNLLAIQNELPKDFELPPVAVVDFNKHSLNPTAIGGYDKYTGIMYFNSQYNTQEKVLDFVNKSKGFFANTTEYAPFLHELGHKYYEDSIKRLAIAQNMSYNDMKKIVDRKIYNYIESNGGNYFAEENLSGYANKGWNLGADGYTEVVAECFSVRKENLIATEILSLLG